MQYHLGKEVWLTELGLKNSLSTGILRTQFSESVEHVTGIVEVRGSNPIQARFFSAYFPKCVGCIHITAVISRVFKKLKLFTVRVEGLVELTDRSITVFFTENQVIHVTNL